MSPLYLLAPVVFMLLQWLVLRALAGQGLKLALERVAREDSANAGTPAPSASSGSSDSSATPS